MDDDALRPVRHALREERRRRGLSQQELAGMVGYSRKWLSDFERGASDPPASMVFRMASLMGIPFRLGTPGSTASPPQEAMADIEEEGL